MLFKMNQGIGNDPFTSKNALITFIKQIMIPLDE